MTACCSAADVFLPLQVGAFPVLMSYGPYAKGLAFQEGFTQAWELMAKETPDRVVGPTNGWAGSPSTGRELAGKFKASMTATAIRTIISHPCGASAQVIFVPGIC